MNSQITMSKREAYYEVLEILKLMNIEDIEKIPKRLIRFFNKNKAENYDFKIDKSLPLKSQKLKDETRVILAMINVNYWSCETRKKELLDLYKSNQANYEKKIREKYNPDCIFQNQSINNTVTVNENEQLAEYNQEKWYQKICNKILNIFKNLKK